MGFIQGLKNLFKRDEHCASRRTYLYLTVVGTRNFLMGFLLLIFADDFTNTAFDVAFDYMPKIYWASAMLVVAVGLLLTTVSRRLTLTRLIVVISGIIMAVLAGSSLANILIVHNAVSSLWPPIVFLAIVGKDFIIVSLPFTRPHGFLTDSEPDPLAEQARELPAHVEV